MDLSQQPSGELKIGQHDLAKILEATCHSTYKLLNGTPHWNKFSDTVIEARKTGLSEVSQFDGLLKKNINTCVQNYYKTKADFSDKIPDNPKGYKTKGEHNARGKTEMVLGDLSTTPLSNHNLAQAKQKLREKILREVVKAKLLEQLSIDRNSPDIVQFSEAVKSAIEKLALPAIDVDSLVNLDLSTELDDKVMSPLYSGSV